MPGRFRNLTGSKPRGVAGRNAGISWVLNNTSQGVVYFADDDNSYDIRLFNEVNIDHLIRIINLFIFEIRKTRRVSFFPVGLVSRLGVSTPIVRAGRIVGFYDGWIGNRLFPVDMAGFAVNIQTLKEVKTGP